MYIMSVRRVYTSIPSVFQNFMRMSLTLQFVLEVYFATLAVILIIVAAILAPPQSAFDSIYCDLSHVGTHPFSGSVPGAARKLFALTVCMLFHLLVAFHSSTDANISFQSGLPSVKVRCQSELFSGRHHWPQLQSVLFVPVQRVCSFPYAYKVSINVPRMRQLMWNPYRGLWALTFCLCRILYTAVVNPRMPKIFKHYSISRQCSFTPVSFSLACQFSKLIHCCIQFRSNICIWFWSVPGPATVRTESDTVTFSSVINCFVNDCQFVKLSPHDAWFVFVMRHDSCIVCMKKCV